MPAQLCCTLLSQALRLPVHLVELQLRLARTS